MPVVAPFLIKHSCSSSQVVPQPEMTPERFGPQPLCRRAVCRNRAPHDPRLRALPRGAKPDEQQRDVVRPGSSSPCVVDQVRARVAHGEVQQPVQLRPACRPSSGRGVPVRPSSAVVRCSAHSTTLRPDRLTLPGRPGATGPAPHKRPSPPSRTFAGVACDEPGHRGAATRVDALDRNPAEFGCALVAAGGVQAAPEGCSAQQHGDEDGRHDSDPDRDGQPERPPLTEPVEPGVVGVTVAEAGVGRAAGQLVGAVVRATYSRPRGAMNGRAADHRASPDNLSEMRGCQDEAA